MSLLAKRTAGTVPFLDLKAQYQSIRDEILPAVSAVLESGQYVLGEAVADFERKFAEYCGCAYGVAVNSGTSALHLALLAAGVGPGDEVITPSFTFVATTAAIGYCGARPILVDIDPRTFNLDVEQVKRVITRKTKVILPVHLYGQSADMDPILEVARERKLIVIEDACQAHGAMYRGRKIGSIGELACFSFYPGKNLGAYGEGGIVVTNSAAHDRVLRMLRDWGQEKKYHHVLKGFNYRMEALQGAILGVKLRHLEKWTEARRKHAARYHRQLAALGIQTPQAMPENRHVYHVYALRMANRDAVQQSLHHHGVQTGIHYPIPVHLQEAYTHLGYRPGALPHSEQAANEVLSLPMYAELTDAQIDRVCSVVGEVVKSRAAVARPAA
jgi:dTDP-4-amino-4,6-dideoxygalactose transaminase